jgi:Methylase involved in ubiquinone/menaquinone biosynthesis
MTVLQALLMRAFGRPQGILGRLGGAIMARANANFGAWVSSLLDVGRTDTVLEVGFGPGVVIQRLSALAVEGHVAGIDVSREMLEQARARSAMAIRRGRVDLRQGSVENLPFADASFDKALAVNSMQVWPDTAAGLREIWRILKPGGKIALGFSVHSGQSREGLTDRVEAAGFKNVRVETAQNGFCVVATKPADRNRRGITAS